MQPFDLVFLDPPYGKELGVRALQSAAQGGWIREGAVAVLEERADAEIVLPAGFEVIDTRVYGDTKLIVMRAFPPPAQRKPGGPEAPDVLDDRSAGTWVPMKSLKVLGFISFLAVAAVLAVPAQAFTSGGWQGQANRDDDGSFRDCTMTADYANGITLAFIISRDFGWGLVLANDKWNLQVGVEEPVTLSIDKLAPIVGTAKVVDAHGILVPLDNADPVVEAMRGGHKLAVVTPAGDVSFELSGTRDAIAALARCVSENSRPRRPAASRPRRRRPATIANKLFTASEAEAFASDLLASAGISDYEMTDPSETPMPSFDVVWTYENGIVAALVGYKEMRAVDLDVAADAVMADDAKNCTGNFASGRKISEPAKLVSVKRLFTSCRSAGKSVEIHYTLVKTKSGHLIQLAHLNLGGATGNVADADSPFLHGAVLSSYK